MTATQFGAQGFNNSAETTIHVDRIEGSWEIPSKPAIIWVERFERNQWIKCEQRFSPSQGRYEYTGKWEVIG